MPLMTLPDVSSDAPDPAAADPTDSGDLLGDRLLAAAAEVFAERGYDGAGVAEIARRAGVTTGAIYSRFAGKAELLAAALDARTLDEFDELFADHRFEGRMEDILTVAGSQLIKRAPNPTQALLLEAFVAARRDPHVADLLRRRIYDRRSSLTNIIEAAKESGGIDEALDTDALVTFCHSVGFGFLLFEALDLPLPAPGAWEQLISLLVAATHGKTKTSADPQVSTTPDRTDRADQPETSEQKEC